MQNMPYKNRNFAFSIALLITLIAALLIRMGAIGVSGLWMDEIYGASYINLNPLELIVAVLRFDVQPPLYYLQLQLWGIVSHSDAWLLANSIAWSMATIFIATYGAYRFSGRKAALVTAGLASVLGSEVFYASDLRMYSMLSCLAVIAWIRAEYWARHPDTKNSFWLVTLLALLAATHSAAFVVISAVLLYGLLRRICLHDLIETLHSWKVIIATGIFMAPWLINASLRSISQTTRPDFHSIVNTFSGWPLGYGGLEIPFSIKILFFGIVATAVLLGIIFGDKITRLVLISFVVWPIVLAATVSFLVRPIWIPRLFGFGAPFFAISMGMLLTSSLLEKKGHLDSMRVAVSAFTVCIVLLGILAWQQNHTPWKMQYRAAAIFIRDHNAKKLPIYVPSNVTFWAMARYLRGPDWGSILKVQDPVKPDHSAKWREIYARLGKTWLERLGLEAKTRHIETSSGPMWIGYSPLPPKVYDHGIWLVGDNTLMMKKNNCHNALQIGLHKFRGVVVVQCSDTKLYMDKPKTGGRINNRT